jgi:hypothetical protein
MNSTQVDVKEYGYFAGDDWRNAEGNQAFGVHEPYIVGGCLPASPRAAGSAGIPSKGAIQCRPI